MVALYIVSVLLVLLIGLLVLRTVRFKPSQRSEPESVTIKLDETRIIESLKSMIKFKTISHLDRTRDNEAAFDGFIAYLKTRYPLIQAASETTELPDRAIVFKIKGASNEQPLVLMSHYDVVPENGTWKHDPFLGEVIDDSIYGRGTLDTKGTLASIMEAVEHLLKSQYAFKQDIYLAFCGDEEIRGGSSGNVVNYLKKKGVKPGLVLDEGGAIVSNVFPGVQQEAAVIGLAEKGFISLEMISKSGGGHASMPPKETPVTLLSEGVRRLNEGNLFKMKRTPSVNALFDTVARHSESFMIRMIFANLWLFFPLVKRLAKASGGELSSILKTTQAFTMMSGSEAINVLPSEARIGINYRVLTGETVSEIVEKVDKKVKPLGIETNLLYHTEATPISVMDQTFDVLTDAIRTTWGDMITAPYLMMAATDSRYYHAISDHVYRFSPMRMSKSDRQTIHGVDEAIKINHLMECVRFYITLLKRYS